MGNIATPNTPYCLGFQQASLSVGNKTFNTQNPPISYSVDGGTVTVFDALGVIGITSYSSDDFVEISSSPASPNTNYCSSAKAVLTWSSGTVETLNAPISYQLRSNIVEWGDGGVVQGIYNAPTSINSASIQSNANKLLINGQIETFSKPVASWQNIPQSQLQVNWGGGDIVTINGSTGNLTKPTQDVLWREYFVSVDIYRNGQYLLGRTDSSVRSVTPPNFFIHRWVASWGRAATVAWTATGFRSSSGFIENNTQFYDFNTTASGVNSLGTPFNVKSGRWDIIDRDDQTYQIIASGLTGVTGVYSNVIKTVVTTDTGATSERWGDLNPSISTITTNCILRVTFSDNTTQDLVFPACPTVQSLSGCTVAIVLANSTTENILVDPCPDFVNVINNEVTVFDDTGQIFKTDYLTPPLNFQVTCYDFNVTEVSYVCQGDCPSGTEFRCVCPETNTIMCYGFDPENPNVFKPLFTTQITS